MLATISGGGTFTRQNISDINANFQTLQGVDLWVRPQNGNNNDGNGSYDAAYATMAGVSRYLEPGIKIGISGVLKEQFTGPLGVNNVTIVGDQYVPRQATTSGVANGGGATWLAPASPTVSLPLIRVQGQGWSILNLYLNSADITSNGCIQPYTIGDPPTQADGAHLLVDNCILTGDAYGVYASGGTNFVTIQNSTLFGFSGAGDVAIAQTVGAGVGTLLGWKVLNCRFYNNATNIVMPWSHSLMKDCMVENGTAANINGAGATVPNYYINNYFNIAAADFDPAGGTTGTSGDVWSNILTDAIETGLPAN
jgi:hypothetical protein